MNVHHTRASALYRQWRKWTYFAKSSIERFSRYRLRYHCPPATEGHYLLTFDDGPVEATRDILDLLDMHGEKALFFMLGENILKYPDIAREAHARGHLIGSHGYSHTSMKKLPLSEMSSQIQKGFAVIEQCTGQRSSYFRPPYGEIGPLQALALIRAGITICLWSCNVLEDGTMKFADPSLKYPGVKKEIILLHDHLPLPLIESVLVYCGEHGKPK